MSFLYEAQDKLVRQIFLAPDHDPLHQVIFSYKDSIQAMGRSRGGSGLGFRVWGFTETFP